MRLCLYKQRGMARKQGDMNMNENLNINDHPRKKIKAVMINISTYPLDTHCKN